MIETSNSANEQLEKSLQNTQHTLHLEKLQKNGEIANLEKKLSEHRLKENKILEEMELLKKDRDGKID